MKGQIHPQYFNEAVVTCNGCHTIFKTGSTKENIRVDICSNCHPFYTGLAKFIDTEGRVEAFKRRETQKIAKVEKKKEEKNTNQPRTLKEMLQMEG